MNPESLPKTFQPRAPFAALALDLDGTLLRPDLSLAPGATEIVRALAARGVPTHIVTGRMQPSARWVWEALGLDTAIVSYNGAKGAVPDGPELFHLRLPEGLAEDLHRLCAARGWQLNHYLDDCLVIPELVPSARWYAEQYKAPTRLLPVDAILAGPTSTKLLVIPGQPQEGPTPPELLNAARDEIAACCGARAHVTKSSRLFVEIIAPGVDKGSGLRRLAEATGIPMERWVGVGDGANDIELLKTAGLGVGVEGGEAELLACADWVVPPLWEDGFKRLVREVFRLAV